MGELDTTNGAFGLSILMIPLSNFQVGTAIPKMID